MSKYPLRQKFTGGKFVYLSAAQDLIKKCTDKHRAALFTTCNKLGVPHATWMGTLDAPSLTRIITVTSPDSRKIQNLIHNPTVEWMFTSDSMSEIVYLRGKVSIIQDPDTIFEIVDGPIDLSKAFFMKFGHKGRNFSVLETTVSEIEYCAPKANLYISFPIKQVNEYLEKIVSQTSHESTETPVISKQAKNTNPDLASLAN